MAEAVLAHVVAKAAARAPRRPRPRAARSAARCAVPAPARSARRARRARRAARRRGRARALARAWPELRRRSAAGASRSTSQTSSSSSNCAARASSVAGVVDDERVAVEDELVLAADERAERERGDVLAGALDDHRLALEALAGVVGRGGEVDDQRRAGERLVRARRPGLPDVLADRDADAVPRRARSGRPRAGLEVALLVEDAVVGQVHLAVDRRDAPVREHGGGVVDVGAALGEADDRRRCPRVRAASRSTAASASRRKCSL